MGGFPVHETEGEWLDLDADSEVWNAPSMPGEAPASGLESAKLAGWGICDGNFSKCEESVQGEIVSTI